MGSETLVNYRIFFNDANNKLKGPFTERQVQELYKEDCWFDRSFPFYFMNNDNSPDDSTPSFTLEELCTRNGFGAPFRLPSGFVPLENTRAQAEQKLLCLEEEIRKLRVEHADVLLAKERMEKEKMREWAQGAAEFFIHMCECFKGSAKLHIDEEIFPLIESRVQKMNEDGYILIKELFRRIKKEKFLFCAFCDRFMFSVRQTSMHICSPEHISKVNSVSSVYQRVNNLLIKMVGIQDVRGMFEKDAEIVRSQRERWSLMSLEDPELRPTREFVNDLNQAFHTNSVPGKVPFTKTQFAQRIVLRLQPYMVHAMANDLLKHIGNAKTRCISCKLIFANTTEYFKHLISFAHVREAGLYDSVTITVNLYIAHLEKLTDEAEE